MGAWGIAMIVAAILLFAMNVSYKQRLAAQAVERQINDRKMDDANRIVARMQEVDRAIGKYIAVYNTMPPAVSELVSKGLLRDNFGSSEFEASISIVNGRAVAVHNASDLSDELVTHKAESINFSGMRETIKSQSVYSSSGN